MIKNGLNELSFRKRVILVVFVMVLFLTLPYLFDFRSTLLIVDTISIFLTILIWYKDRILKIDVKLKYVIYYTALLIISLYVFPKDSSLVFDVFTHAPLREEIIFRFFMIGIFYKYYKFEDEDKSYFVKMLFTSNIIFMILHSYNFGIFIIGLILSIIYIKGGLISSMLAHTIYNLYLSNEYYCTKILVFMPIVFSISDARALYENVSEKNTKTSS